MTAAGLIDLAIHRNSLIGGDDFKSGQTKMKSVLVDFLVGAGIKVFGSFFLTSSPLLRHWKYIYVPRKIGKDFDVHFIMLFISRLRL